jgi:hypothetical protein
MTTLQIVLSVLCGLLLVQLAVLIARDLPPGRISYALLALVEVGLVVQLVLGLAMVFDDHRGVSVPTYVGYLVGALVVLPLAAGWAWAETGSREDDATGRDSTRGGTAVLLVAVLVMPVLFVRLHDIWSTHV